MDLRLILLIPLLAGCSGLQQALQPSDAGPGLGSHSYNVLPDGSLKVDVHSIYGGPAVTVEGEGESRKMTITPASRIQVEKLIDVLSIP